MARTHLQNKLRNDKMNQEFKSGVNKKLTIQRSDLFRKKKKILTQELSQIN